MSTDHSKIVSILIPCFNAEQWIGDAIESALSQTFHHCEVIVVDDGSTDQSLKIIESFGNRVRAESTSNNGGSAARNRLLELSNGEWLQYLDADDYLLADKIEQQINFLQLHPEVDVVFSPSLIDQNGAIELLPISEPHDPWCLLARWHLPQTGSPLWRADSLRQVNGWKVDQPCCQEHELYFRLLANGSIFSYFDNAGSVYRKWSDATVCERDPKLVFEKRLEIKDRIENHLKNSGELTSNRQDAINQARFEIARAIWKYDRDLAGSIEQTIRQSPRTFRPSGDAGPKLYSLAYRAFGFRAAEHIADMLRS